MQTKTINIALLDNDKKEACKVVTDFCTDLKSVLLESDDSFSGYSKIRTFEYPNYSFKITIPNVNVNFEDAIKQICTTDFDVIIYLNLAHRKKLAVESQREGQLIALDFPALGCSFRTCLENIDNFKRSNFTNPLLMMLGQQDKNSSLSSLPVELVEQEVCSRFFALPYSIFNKPLKFVALQEKDKLSENATNIKP